MQRRKQQHSNAEAMPKLTLQAPASILLHAVCAAQFNTYLGSLSAAEGWKLQMAQGASPPGRCQIPLGGLVRQLLTERRP